MGYLYAITRDADLAEEVYQNAAVVVMEQSAKSESIRDSVPGPKKSFVDRRFMLSEKERSPRNTREPCHLNCLMLFRTFF